MKLNFSELLNMKEMEKLIS